jgi:nicotinate-nucleotide adenylyltransferase
MTTAARIGLLGGTLDPIHLGHVDTALAARQALDLDRVIVLPSSVPPHRQYQPVASRFHRFAMTALAVNGVDGLAASDLELGAAGPSYTADTLVRFRENSGLPALQVFFITGADAFAEIETWHRYPDVLDLSHFVVISRPGFPVEALRTRLPALAARMASAPSGAHGARFVHAGVESGRSAREFPAIFLVDALTPDVSSTDIRRRLRAGEAPTGLVPAAVERHIVQHGLYTDGPPSFAANHLHGQN